jgi:hypothetical protein
MDKKDKMQDRKGVADMVYTFWTGGG